MLKAAHLRPGPTEGSRLSGARSTSQRSARAAASSPLERMMSCATGPWATPVQPAP